MTKPRHLRSVPAPAERPLAALTMAEKRAAVLRDFKADPWIMGEGARFFTPDRVAQLSADNDARRKRNK